MASGWNAVGAAAGALGVAVPAGFETAARQFLTELTRWSRAGRLTGYRSDSAQIEHLVIESLLLLAVLPLPASPLLDIGTGPGVPGLLLKLARPEWAVTLVEARRRPSNFLRHVVRELGLSGEVDHEARAEALGGDPALAGRFRTVTMRAVAPRPAALALAWPFLDPAGHVVVALRPGDRPGVGRIARAAVPRPAPSLPLERTFLIIGAGELAAVSRETLARSRRLAKGVSRETGGRRGARPGRRQPEGRRREDDDRRRPGRRARRGRASDTPG